MKRVLYVQYTNPGGYPPLEHSSKMLAEAGWEVLFLGTGALGADNLELPPREGIVVRRMPFEAPGWRQKLHYLRFCLWVLATALVWRPRWVYASDPLSCPVALALTWMPGLRVIYHEHDSPAARTAGSWFQRMVSSARRAVARRASLCVLPNELRLERFRSELEPQSRCASVWNCPAVDEVVAVPRSPAESPVWLLYHGSIVPERLPPAVMHALAALPESVHLRIAGYETTGARAYVSELRQLTAKLNIAHRVEFLGAIPRRADLLAQTAKSDIGLALMPLSTSDWNCESMAGASNKPFDYLGSGVPVIVSDLPAWSGMFVRPGYGVACDPTDAGGITAAVRSLIEDPSEMRRLGEAGRQRILNEWNYERVFAPVFELMTEGLIERKV